MMRGIQKVAEMGDFVPAAIGAGVGGAGAYALANHLAGPMMAAKQQAFVTAAKEFGAAKAIPVMAGAVGALLLGSMIASHLKAKHRREMMSAQWQAANQYSTPQQVTEAYK